MKKILLPLFLAVPFFIQSSENFLDFAKKLYSERFVRLPLEQKKVVISWLMFRIKTLDKALRTVDNSLLTWRDFKEEKSCRKKESKEASNITKAIHFYAKKYYRDKLSADLKNVSSDDFYRSFLDSKWDAYKDLLCLYNQIFFVIFKEESKSSRDTLLLSKL